MQRAGGMPAARERGVLLVGLLVGMTVLIILLTASVQSWGAIMRREREQELRFRGQQYVTAIRLYAKDHGGNYPMELEVLLKKGPRGHRYIRQLFPDPFDSDGKWNLLYLAPSGKGAINPNARFPNALAGQPGAAGLGQVAGTLSGRQKRADQRSRDRDRERSGFDKRKSGFGGATMTGPIVGVVSTSAERAFGMYYNKHYFDEWEFHVFINLVPDPRQRTGGITPNTTNPQNRRGVIDKSTLDREAPGPARQ